jgi:hypothetical protein
MVSPSEGHGLGFTGQAVFGRHCHDGLCEWRRDGRWPPRKPPNRFMTPET